LVTAAAVSIGELRVGADDVWWSELRPEEAGRTQIVRHHPGGKLTDVLPADYAARTRAHEYGGGAWWLHDDTVFFCNWDDQRVYRLDPGRDPIPLTPDPAIRHGDRYADGCLTADGRWVIAVNEHHEPSEPGRAVEPTNRLVAFAAHPVSEPGELSEPVVVVSGADFYSNPRISPDGQWLTWLEWHHPHMPWDSTELFVAPLHSDSSGVRVDVEARRRIAGPGEWLFQPEWAPDGSLWFASDRTGRSLLYRVGGIGHDAPDEPVGVSMVDGDVATPQWVFGMRRYCFLPDGRVLFAFTAAGVDHLAVCTPDDMHAVGSWCVDELRSPWTSLSGLVAFGDGAALIAASFTEEPTVCALDIGANGSLAATPLRPPRSLGLDAAWISVPEHVSFPTADGESAHGFFYRPAHPEVSGPEGELPPLLVVIHGGPTSAARPMLQLSVQYWTSRGIAVLDVNYRGSTGYGRAFRQALAGRWGVADVEDCVAGARWLAERGDVDGARLAIRGGSAGGFTTLCALVFHDLFSAGASLYGVTDLEALARDTHKFESRYLDGLVGPYPERRDLYVERSPINHVERLRTPLIIFQGLEDEVVPPAQAETLVAALRANRVPFAYVPFEGEQHGFRRAENIRRVLGAELFFYGRVFSFDASDAEPVPIENA
jgi:dipeptidyl aminopeptidase/acylaminoacyl peptidase